MSSPHLRAQNLDNRSPDLFGVGRSLVDKDDVTNRELVASRISEVTGSAAPDYDGSHVKVWVRKSNIVGRILCVERDEARRGAPIVCCLEANNGEDAGAAIVDAVIWFAAAIGRNLSPDHLAELRREIDHVRAKKKTQQAILVALIFALLVLLTWAAVRPR